MAIAMILAHLLADYVFQPNRLAYWKSQQIEGVLAHTGIVVVVTLVVVAVVRITAFESAAVWSDCC